MTNVGDQHDDEREGDAERKRRKRAKDRDLRIPRVDEPNRRLDCLMDTPLFLKTYFPGVFYQPFTLDRLAMIGSIDHAASYVGDQAIAGPRGDGKTRTALFTSGKLCIARRLSFPLIISKSSSRANRELKNLKHAFTTSSLLAADFPELMVPILDVKNWSSRARQQTVYMHETNMEWGEDCIIFPTIPSELLWANGWNSELESVACGQVLASLGIEGPIRGYSVREKRPDLAIIDDIDDRDSARSETQTEVRESIIEEDIGGLAGPDRTISRVMLCTLINRTCIAAKYTDRSIKSSWKGVRNKIIEEWPERQDLCEQYISLRKTRTEDDPDARVAFRFWRDNLEEIERGSKVTNPYRFDSRLMPDGEPAELSALQACFNLIADRSRENFDTEYQNDPPDEGEAKSKGITAEIVQQRLGMYERRVAPKGCIALTAGFDLGQRRCHWVVIAWTEGARGYVIDYGVQTVEDADIIGPEKAIFLALQAWRDDITEDPYSDIDGEIKPIDIVLIDNGNGRWEDCAYRFVSMYGSPFWASKGFGSTHKRSPFRMPQKPDKRTRVGEQWYAKIQPGKGWLVGLNADFWKEWLQDRFMAMPGNEGSLMLFRFENMEDKKLSSAQSHRDYAESIVSETVMEWAEKNKGNMRKWQVHQRWKNHYLDATSMACAGSAMKGVYLLSTKAAGRIAAAARPPMAGAPKQDQPKPEPRRDADDGWSVPL
jgi:hypothetical protein